ncbi:DUF3488 and transglutaminase-like domain-containing protein [Cerasicoccus maritimus]|uniref:transglutaminase family protein n=1 Tax=Cerasicoccus maritimus TaxID=490089 RepID=UPI0028526CDE|nr:DUF3488 and transglutaminase-like domain-containing protein [Cerasicoccus maritimus]
MPTLVATSRVRLNESELHQLKWFLGQFLSLISMWSLLSLESIASGLVLLFFVGIVTVTAMPSLVGRIPPALNKAGTPALILIIAVDFMLHGANFLDPMIRMVGLLTFYRSLQFRKRREDLQLLLLTLFTLIIVGVLLISISFALQMLIFTPIAMGLLFLVNLLESSHDRVLQADDWENYSWSRFLRRLRYGLDFRLLASAGVLFGIVVVISTVIFISLPRIKMDQALPFLQLQAGSGIGFSDTIRYGDVSELLNGKDSIALRVEVSEPDKIPTRPYWRMVVLDQYDPIDSTFRVSTVSRNFTQVNAQEGNRYSNMDTPQRYMGGNVLEQMDYYLEGNVSSYLPLIGPFESIKFGQRVKFFPGEDFNIFELETPMASTFGYSLTNVSLSESMQASHREARALNSVYGKPTFIEERGGSLRDLKYPETTVTVPAEGENLDFLQAAVEEITGGEKLSAVEFSRRASQWLKEHYSYALRTGLPLDERSDSLLYWMRNAETGWCEHFSGSFIMLARTAGYPARAVAGFAGAAWNDYENYFVVRNRMAHAWVEVYDGNGRWFRVDPTPASNSMLAGLDGGMQGAMPTESGWEAWLDSVRMVWYRRVINFDQKDQEELASNIRQMSVGAFKKFQTNLMLKWEAFKRWLTEGWSLDKVRDTALSVLVICAMTLAVRGLYVLWLGWRSAYAKGQGKTFNDPVRRRAGRMLARFRPHYAAAQEKLAGDELRRWQLTYQELLNLRFGENPGDSGWKSTIKSARRLIRSGVKSASTKPGAAL